MGSDVVGLKVYTPKHVYRYCTDCALKRYDLSSPEQFYLLTEVQIVGVVLTQEDDTEIYGKICTHCHTPIDGWQQCKYCREIFWPEVESHSCAELRQAEERLYRKYGDNWDGNLDWLVKHWEKSPVS